MPNLQILRKVFTWLISFYLVFLGWTNWLHLPYLSNKVQLTEIVFIPIFLLWLILIFQGEIKKPHLEKLDFAILAYLLANILSTIFNPNFTTLTELAGRTYLVLVYFIFSTSFRHVIPIHKGGKVICWLVLLTVVPALLGFMAAELTGQSNQLVWFYPDYPYFGDVFRAKGWMQSPNLLFNLLVCVFFIGMLIKAEIKIWLLISGIFVAILTLAKSWLFFSVSMLLMFSFSQRALIKYGLRGVAILLFVFASMSIYVLPKSGEACSLSDNIPTNRVGKPFYENNDFCLVQTSYAILHQTEIKEGHKFLPFGVGPGNFINQVSEFKEKGLYPNHMEAFEAHSTLFATYIELGIPGILALAFFLFTLVMQIKDLNYHYKIIFILLFLFLAQEAIFNDLNNFRHLWVIIAILSASNNQKPNP